MEKNKRFGKRAGALLTAVCLAVGFLVLPSSSGYALYNDAVYDSYKNMNASDSSGARYVVPNLYRQDASYTNVKTFPLVVTDGVEYVPLDIFALFSYLEVVYGKVSYSFYINNTKNAHYIAFDIDNGTTTTDSGETLDIESKLFYRTYYVPAKAVCEVLGINFESYDSPDDGIRAARVSDSKAKYSLNELVKMYSPVKNTTENTPSDTKDDDSAQAPDKDDNTGKNDPVIQPEDKSDTDKDPPKEEKDDPYKSVAARNIYLTFDDLPNANTGAVLSALRQSGVKASFFVTEEALLAYPDAVRRMIADGHTVGLYISPADGQEVLSNEALCARIAAAEEALKLVTKEKTRLIRLAPGHAGALEDNGFYAYAAERGYRFYNYTADARDGAGRAQAIFTALCTTLVGNNPKAVRTLHVRFGSHAATADVLAKLDEFCEEYTQFKLISFDETTLLP